MSLIEKAVQRLDALKQANGADETVPPKAAPVVAEAVHEQVHDSGRTSSSVPLATPVPTPNPNVSREVHIDLERLGAMGMVTPDVPRAAIAEEFRLIKRPLLRNATVSGPSAIENGSLIMVTSAMPGEGKSFTAINLAVSMAMELDYTVLLVDADVSRPSVLNRLGLPPERGLMDVLSGEVSDLGDVLLRTNIEKLSILPAGMPHPRATEMLASESMNRLLEQIANRYADRIIVFDSPPLLVTTEARVLATHMGQVVIVVEAGRTTHATVKQALATIENCPVKLMVLNKSRENAAGSYYGYGYGYGAEPRSEAA
ncbi:MAG: XrtA-associated tyrosine autokinase [Azoarcus sp.]|nr:XrtA-associated tyrosine autokinase [Azoarcus sp.]